MLLYLFLEIANCVINFTIPTEKGESNSISSLVESSDKSKNEVLVIDNNSEYANEYTKVYPKLPFVYNVDPTTKVILLGIGILLFTLVLTTTSKMAQEILKIRGNRDNIKV